MTKTKKIYKYELGTEEEVRVLRVPKGAKPLAVGSQYGSPQIWFEVDPKAKESVRKINVVYTGREFTPSKKLGKYLGSYQHNQTVCHVFV